MNVHALYHLVPCVKHLGPIWTFWSFPFETILGRIKTFSHSRREVEHQMGLTSNMMSCHKMLVEAASIDYVNLSAEDKEVKVHCIEA